MKEGVFQIAKLANNRSLVDISYSYEIQRFSITVLEYGEGSKGSKQFATAYLDTDSMSLLARDIVFKEFEGFASYGGKAKAREIKIQLKNGKYAFFVREGEGSRMKNGGLKLIKETSKAMSIVTEQDTRKAFCSVLDYVVVLSVADNEIRWKKSQPSKIEEKETPQKPSDKDKTENTQNDIDDLSDLDLDFDFN
jgi:hypothetical protein